MARSLTHHWKRSLVGAVVVLVALVGLSFAGESASDDFSIPGTDTQKVVDLFEAHSPERTGTEAQVVFVAKTGKITDPANQAAAAKALAKISTLKGVAGVPSPFDAKAGTVSKDATVAFTTVQYRTKETDIRKADGVALIDAAELAKGSAVEVGVRGPLADLAQEQSFPIGEMVGILIAAFLLYILFRSKATPAITLLAAIIGVIMGQALLAAASTPLGLPVFAAFLAGLLGLGAGIDYSLLVVGRFREQIAAGYSVRDASAKAAATAGSAVVTAGLIVMVAIAGLLAIGIPIIGKMGLGAAVGVAGVVISAVTILPALMGAFAKRIKPRDASQVLPSPAFTRWGEIVTERPWLSIGAGVLVLLVLASPATHIRLGQPDDGNKAPGSTQRIAYDAISKGFGPGFSGPFLVAAELPKGGGSQSAQLTALQETIAKTPGVAFVSPPQTTPDGGLAILSAIPTTSPQDVKTSDLLDTLRNDVVPAGTKGTELKAYVGGQTAALEDLSQKTADGLPVFIAVVIGLSVLLLMAAFRSLWIPLVSAVFNLLSVGAAFGIVTAVFQDGIGGGLVGAGGGDIPVVFFIPVMLFAILFGLSMDYNVFLLSRIHEAHNEGDEPRAAVIHGMGRIGKVILFAGLIMGSVFISFTTMPDVGQKMIGVGLGLAVLFDVLIVRLVIVPAMVLVLGRHAWTIPSWLDKVLPNVSLEGHLVDSIDPKGPAIGEPGYATPTRKERKAQEREEAAREATPVG